MKTCRLFGWPKNAVSILITAVAIAIFGVSLAGCGSSMQMGGPTPAKTTQVVVLLTSTANDQLEIFNVFIASIALTDSTGKSTTIFTSAIENGTSVEWMHLNGSSEPFLTVTLPQGTYTSANMTIDGCNFTNVIFTGQTISTDTFAQGLCAQGTGIATVNLPAPIKVAGSVMALSLDMQVLQSFTLVGDGTPSETYTISPTFSLTPVSIAAEPTDETNGKVIGVNGQVMSLNMNGNSFTAQTTDGAMLTLNTNASTTFQGIAAFSSLSTNLLVNFDAAIQPDGSLLATRVEVDDPAQSAAVIGPFEVPVSPADSFLTLLLQPNGCSITGTPFCGTVYQFNGNTVFNVSQQFPNVASLPFPATFSSASFLEGQNISVFEPASSSNENIPNPTAITLMPQTVNGMVTAISNDGGFTVYTVTLASYDLFPVIQVYTASLPLPHLTNPTTIVIYADTGAKFLNSGGMVNVGSLLRFKGLVFDDNGTMRMDASEIYDGVTE